MTDDYRLTDHTLRDYQEEALAWATDRQRRVVCLPTGTGKTLIGCAWCCHHLDRGRVDRILVVEPSRFLVEQVTDYYRTHTTIPTERLYGTTERTTRLDQWDDGTVVVTTPQTAVNDLSTLEFDAIVVDECHHTVGQHPCARLLRAVDIETALGLSATVPRSRERAVESLVGEIRRWTWSQLPDEHVTEWYGEVYDAPYPDSYRSIVETLEQFRLDFDGTRYAGLPTLGIRMVSRDGALALQETLERETIMGDMMGAELLPSLRDARPLHKLDVCRAALADHEFEKAILFVDRVAVARRLEARLDDYETVTLLGRLHAGSSAQQQAVEAAQAPETDLIIATAAGEEGIDLPAADLLIVWSNVVSAVRFIQRLGRIMRPDGTNRPNVAVYLATPDSPDYEALRHGLSAASRAGLDIAGLDEDVIRRNSIIDRVRETLDAQPAQRETVAETLDQPPSKVDDWLRQTIRAGDVFYVYSVPDDLNDWRKAADGFAAAFGYGDTQPTSGSPNERLSNNFSPGTEDRYYVRRSEIPLLQTEFYELFDETGDTYISVSYGPSHAERGQHESRGPARTVEQSMRQTLDDADRFYANVSAEERTPTFTVQMTYHGPATEAVIGTVLHNAAGVTQTLSERLSSE